MQLNRQHTKNTFANSEKKKSRAFIPPINFGFALFRAPENPKIMNDWMTQIRASSGYDSQS